MRTTVLVTNDDGVQSVLLHELVRKLSDADLDVVVVAPTHDQSACGQKLNMNRNLLLRTHDSTSSAISANTVDKAQFYCLDGSPSDCIIAALEPRNGVLAQLGTHARLVVSGINKGPNLASDVLYSGTFAAARQAGMYGVPSIATSWASYEKLRPSDVDHATDATLRVVTAALRILLEDSGSSSQPLRSELITRDHHRFRPNPPGNSPGDQGQQAVPNGDCPNTVKHLRDGFRHGDLVINLNVPPEWNGRFQPSTLGAMMYRDVLHDIEASDFASASAKSCEDGSPGRVARVVRIGGGGVHVMPDVPNSDTDAVKRGFAALSTLNCWPETHPLQLDPAVMQHALHSSSSKDASGLPLWLDHQPAQTR